MTSKVYPTDNLMGKTLPDVRTASGMTYTGGTIINWVSGIIQCQHAGLVRRGIRIKVGGRTDIRVRWPVHEERFHVVEQ